MGLRSPELYQGRDWLTYRVSVAQAFDTLDRLRDLCRPSPLMPGLSFSAQGLSLAPHELPDEETADLLGYVLELCDALSGDIDAVLADLLPYRQNDTLLRWLGFELRLQLDAIREETIGDSETGEPLVNCFDKITAHVSRMRDLLKQIDL